MHLTLRGRVIRLVHGPKENGFRPAVDPLFRSAAQSFGKATMGVVLSGALDDGTYGLKVIKDAGGIAVVQDPREATHPEMPMNAMRFVDVDHVAGAARIAALIADGSGVAEGAAKGEAAMARRQGPDPQNPSEETDVEEMAHELGPPSGLTCPDCGGALWEIHHGALARYRCHVGHQYTTEGLDAEQAETVEGALWSAVRILEERAELRKRMSNRALEAGMDHVANGFSDSARESHRQAHTIRGLLFGRSSSRPTPSLSPEPRATRRTAKKAKTAKRR
jgi:two-component system chemotaxis response regulator CheB